MGRISHVADYKVLRSSRFRLSATDSDSFEIHLPPHTVITERAILAFMADPTSSADNLEYEVVITQRWIDEPPDHGVPNQEYEREVIKSGQFTRGISRGMWAIVKPGLLLLDTPPWQLHDRQTIHERGSVTLSVHFNVTDGQGSVAFSDVVLWFQRKVAEAPEG